MTRKGTLHVGQRKDHVHVKILYNSLYFRVRKRQIRIVMRL